MNLVNDIHVFVHKAAIIKFERSTKLMNTVSHLDGSWNNRIAKNRFTWLSVNKFKSRRLYE